MEEVRQLVQEEGREARNLVAFHVAVDTPARVSRKPPRSVAPPLRRAPPRSAARLRSASAGRDKRSELRARYWALLFGDLQRAVGEIYNTVEAHENLNECQEVILVLENYTRDFKALGEWFRLKWEYDNTPPPQRPQSLAWEIRKTDFVRPESRRTYSVKSSPSVSGKNSPCLSGHNTPSGKNSPVAGKVSPGSGKISPRVPGHTSTSPKANIEFFSNKIASKIALKPEPKAIKETRLSDIKEKDVKENPEDNNIKVEDSVMKESTNDEVEHKPLIEIGKAKECPSITPKPVVIKSCKQSNKQPKVNNKTKSANNNELSSQAKATVAQLDAMENEFLSKQLVENTAKNDNMLNGDIEAENVNKTEIKEDTVEKIEERVEEKVVKKDSSCAESPTKSEDNFADVSNDSSPNPTETVNESENGKEIVSPTDNTVPVLSESTQSTGTQEEKLEIQNSNSNPDKVEGTETTISEPKNNVLKDPEIREQNGTKDENKTETKPDLKATTEIKTAETKPNSRPAYSQAAAKPKQVTTKPDVKVPVKSAPIIRSKTVVEIPNSAPKTRQFPKRNQTSKCSYPFNLTTGRTSLFDTTSSIKAAAKKPTGRNSQIGSGDNKILQNKVDPKKRTPRPISLKINEKGDKKEKPTLTLEKIKDCDEYSSSDTIVTQIDMSRIESSESLKTLVPEELQMIPDVANSIEVLNVDNNKNDNEGWLTVKSRRLSRESKKQSKSHWVNRFHQPSATTSLPTLNMIESPRQENNPITKSPKNNKFDRAKSEQPERFSKPVKTVKVTVKPKSDRVKDPAMIRQKSDVTGLKTRSSRNKIIKKEKKESRPDGELTKNRLHSSLESLTTGLARSQESTEDVFDFDKWKAEFKFTFKYLDEEDQIPNHNEILKSADPSEMSEIAEMTSQIEENERKISLALDFQSECDQRKLCEEEDSLNRQIMELQQVSDIDLDTETDDTETDAEILCEETNVPTCSSPETLGALTASLEEQYETALAGMSWAERVDTLVVLESLVARDPGRAQQLHAKLSQGIKRRGSLQDALRRLQAKQARAERQRLEYQTERAKKIHQLLARVEEVKVAKNQLIDEKRFRMERRLQKAAENRDQHLKDIVRKAHDEEEKLREIAFIKQLEAENRRHEFLDQCRSHTTRLRQMRRDRLNKLEQKAAREAAVGARRQAIEEARRLHVETLMERRKERDARVEEMKGLKKQERDDAAREKAEGVKSRLSALAAAAELEADALRSRIRDKQDASQQRLDKHLQAIREKATGPRQTTTSESQDQKDEEQIETERVEQERREREKQKAIKKKARKVKQKLMANSSEIIGDLTIPDVIPHTTKMHKALYQLTTLLTPLLDDVEKHVDDENVKNNKKLSDNVKLVNGNESNSNTNNTNNNLNSNSKKKNRKESQGNNKVINIEVNKDHDKVINNEVDTGNKDVINNEVKGDRTIINYEINKGDKKVINEVNKPDDYVINNKVKGDDNFDNNELNKGYRKGTKVKRNETAINNEINKVNHKVLSDEVDKDNHTVINNKVNKAPNKKFKGKDTVQNNDIIKGIDNIKKNEVYKANDNLIHNKVKDNDIVINSKIKDNDTMENNKINKCIGNIKNVGTNNVENLNNNNDDGIKVDKTDSKKKKKHKNNMDKPKLCKSSSVCSSLSDMSKASNKSDRRTRVNIDSVVLERHLNELHRIIDKFDMSSREQASCVIIQKRFWLKVLNCLLAVPAEREDLATQFSVKCLTTAVTMISRLVAQCVPSTTFLLSTNLVVYLIKLLSDQLEKDLKSEPREQELAKQITDCLSIAFDTVLCASRVEKQTRQSDEKLDRSEEKLQLASLRARAHMLISYLCLSGCVSRAESAGDVRENVLALLAICFSLTQPIELDIGSERTSALQSLRCALGTSLCGARAEFCALFAQDSDYQTDCDGFVRAARTADFLRTVAEMDHHIIQESFGEGGWPLEFRAAVARLLQQHAPNDKEAPRTNALSQANRRLDQKVSEKMVMDLLILVGFIVVANPQLQDTICEGWSVIKTICNLPANWLVSKPHCHALLPTLIALAERPDTRAVIAAELSLEMLDEYMLTEEANQMKLICVIKQARIKKNSGKK